MITTEDILNMNFYKKEQFTGSYLGMRYLIEKAAIETPGTSENDAAITESAAADVFRVWVWPGPYAFATTGEDKKNAAAFPFTEEGRQQAVDWLNEQWQEKKELWAAAMLH